MSEPTYVPWTCSNCGNAGNARPNTPIRCTCGTVTLSDRVAPRTDRFDLDSEGKEKPCIHLSDADGDELVIHHRGDGVPGYMVECRTMVSLPIPGLPPIPQVTGMYLTPGQAQELMTYLKSVV